MHRVSPGFFHGRRIHTKEASVDIVCPVAVAAPRIFLLHFQASLGVSGLARLLRCEPVLTSLIALPRVNPLQPQTKRGSRSSHRGQAALIGLDF